MDGFQYNDLPQIQVADDSPLNGWAPEYPGHMNYMRHPMARTVNVFGEEVILEGAGYQNMSNMQRFLHGPERPPFTHGYLRTPQGVSYGAPSHTHHMMQCEQRAPPFPATEADYPRDPSPDTASSYTSHVPQNELRSPHTLEQGQYGSPTSYSQSRLPYSQLEQIHGGASTPEAPLTGGGIDPREIQYESDQPESTVEEFERVDNKLELSNYEQDAPSCCKMEVDGDNYHTDSAIGHSLRDPESVHPVSPDEESSDSDYKPKKIKRRRRPSQSSNGSSGRQPQKRAGHGRKTSTTSATSHTSRVNKKNGSSNRNGSGSAGSNTNAARPFPCPLAMFGCISTFSSKNEWKRHVSTQHIKLGFWRCDLCPTTVDTHDPSSIYHNDFNRKDLFTQHLRRMHALPVKEAGAARDRDSKSSEYPVNEDNIADHQKRCYQSLRLPPPQSTCLFCDRTFAGPGSWDERMEHVGRHLEKDRKSGGAAIDIKDWNQDEQLRQWLIAEGLVEVDSTGAARLGDGRPRRTSLANGAESDASGR